MHLVEILYCYSKRLGLSLYELLDWHIAMGRRVRLTYAKSKLHMGNIGWLVGFTPIAC
jgi:hypothetical protein